MKKTILLLALPFVWMMTGCPSGTDTPITDASDTTIAFQEMTNARKFGVKSGIIQMKSSAMGLSQQIEVCFDNYGDLQSSRVTQKLLGKQVDQVSISDTAFVYTYNLQTREGTRAAIDPESPDNINFNCLTREAVSMFSIRKKGKAEVCGRTCDVYTLDYPKAQLKGTFYIWKGITLKSESTVAGISLSMEAVKIQEDVAVPADRFVPPADITFKEAEEVSI